MDTVDITILNICLYYIIYRITSILKVETDIITSIKASSIQQAVIMYIETFKTEVIFIMCMKSNNFQYKSKFVDTDNISFVEIKGKMPKLQIKWYIIQYLPGCSQFPLIQLSFALGIGGGGLPPISDGTREICGSGLSWGGAGRPPRWLFLIGSLTIECDTSPGKPFVGEIWNINLFNVKQTLW